MTKAQLLTLRNRLFLHDEIPEHDLDADLPPYYRPAPDEKAAGLPGRAPAGAGRTAAPPGGAVRGPSRPRPRRRSPTCWPARGARRCPPPWPSPGCCDRWSAIPSIGRAHRPHRLRRGPHLRARVAHQRGADLRPRGPALHPGRRRPGPPLRRERHRPGPPGGHQRGRRGGRLHRRGHLVRDLGRAHDPLLPLLLDVRLPAGRRPALGPRRRRGRGFLLGCTAGRTTLNGEGLQHQDGHSLLLASTVPSVAAYDPAFSYEVATIVEDGIRRMTGPEPEDRVLVPHALQRELPDARAPRRPGRGRTGPARAPSRASTGSPPRSRTGPTAPAVPADGTGRPGPPCCSPGSAWQAAVEARRLLADDWGVDAEALVGDLVQVAAGGRHLGRAVEPPPSRGSGADPVRHRVVWPQSEGPIVAVTDFMRSVPDQVARWMPRRFTSLGTDGFGRSDTRDVLRRFFEIDAAHVVVAVLRRPGRRRAVPSGTRVRGHRPATASTRRPTTRGPTRQDEYRPPHRFGRRSGPRSGRARRRRRSGDLRRTRGTDRACDRFPFGRGRRPRRPGGGGRSREHRLGRHDPGRRPTRARRPRR